MKPHSTTCTPTGPSDLGQISDDSFLRNFIAEVIEYWNWFCGIFSAVEGLCLAFINAPSSVKILTTIGIFLGTTELAQFSITGEYTYNKINVAPKYGPPFVPTIQKRPFYSYAETGPSFNLGFPLYRIQEVPHEELADLIIETAPPYLVNGLKEYLNIALHFSEFYQVDPFWVLSIMWVESHFNPRAKSSVKASGLMQIMPGTSKWLNNLLNRRLSHKLAYELTKDPVHNVELGVFYLDRLLRTFNGNYIYATVAYNMGPTYTLRRLRNRRPVGTKNLYLTKVRAAYARLTRGVRRHLQNSTPAYYDTFVVKRRINYEWQEFEFASWWSFGHENNLALQ